MIFIFLQLSSLASVLVPDLFQKSTAKELEDAHDKNLEWLFWGYHNKDLTVSSKLDQDDMSDYTKEILHTDQNFQLASKT